MRVLVILFHFYFHCSFSRSFVSPFSNEVQSVLLIVWFYRLWTCACSLIRCLFCEWLIKCMDDIIPLQWSRRLKIKTENKCIFFSHSRREWCVLCKFLRTQVKRSDRYLICMHLNNYYLNGENTLERGTQFLYKKNNCSPWIIVEHSWFSSVQHTGNDDYFTSSYYSFEPMQMSICSSMHASFVLISIWCFFCAVLALCTGYCDTHTKQCNYIELNWLQPIVDWFDANDKWRKMRCFVL